MIITIEGKKGEGKTKLAEQISKGKIVHYITEEHLKNGIRFRFSCLYINTDYIIVDDVIDIEAARDFFKTENLWIEQRGQEGFYIPTPDVILIKR